jgi:type IV pilus assembly protein PilM
MLGFVQNIFAPPAHPIGVDFGTGTLRLAQVQSEGDDFKLLAAASAEIPVAIQGDPAARLQFFSETIRELLVNGKFHGRRAILGLPPSAVHIQHLTVQPAQEKILKEAIYAQARQNLPFEPEQALLRHEIAGKSQDKKNPCLHVVVMAADTRWVNQYIAAAKKGRLDVIGMNMPQLALIDCFTNVYRRASDQQSVRMYVDIGGTGTRVTIAQGKRMLFARNLVTGGTHLTAAVASALEISPENALTIRLKLCAGSVENSELVDSALRLAIEKLAGELDRCRNEHESLFPNLKVQRLIFVGGEARLEGLCEQISDQLKIPGQTGDSLCRMVRNSRIGIESAIDRRHPQPAWAAAIGLTIGPRHSD